MNSLNEIMKYALQMAVAFPTAMEAFQKIAEGIASLTGAVSVEDMDASLRDAAVQLEKTQQAIKDNAEWEKQQNP